MSKKTTGIVAGVAGAALLMGGATFALWSDKDQINAGTITSGNLDVALVGAPAWTDVSGDEPRDITLEDFRIVPGDTIEGRFGIDAALEGDNIVADLGLKLDRSTGELLARRDEGVTITYSLVDAEGDVVNGLKDIRAGYSGEVRFVSEQNGDNPGELPTLPADLTGSALYTVVVTAEFDADTPERVRTQATANLQKLKVELEQVR